VTLGRQQPPASDVNTFMSAGGRLANMVEVGFVLVAVALLVLASTTMLGIWLVEKTLNDEESEEQHGGQQPH